MRWLSSFFHLFLPNDCLLCHLHFAPNGLCKVCEEELPWQKNACPCCAEPLDVSFLCGHCLASPPAFDLAIAPLRYESAMRFLVTQLKFHEKLCCANLFAHFILKHLSMLENFHQPDLLLPVPLHAKRIQERGFNQALEIAKPLAKALRIPLARNLLIKKISTLPQVGQSYKLRKKNLKNVFALRKTVEGKHIGVVDDVMTTGATVNEIAKLLKANGAVRVTVFAVARTKKA